MLEVYQELEQGLLSGLIFTSILGWLKCRNGTGIMGLVPKDYVERCDVVIDYSSSSSTDTKRDKRRTLTIEADLAKKVTFKIRKPTD